MALVLLLVSAIEPHKIETEQQLHDTRVGHNLDEAANLSGAVNGLDVGPDVNLNSDLDLDSVAMERRCELMVRRLCSMLPIKCDQNAHSMLDWLNELRAALRPTQPHTNLDNGSLLMDRLDSCVQRLYPKYETWIRLDSISFEPEVGSSDPINGSIAADDNSKAAMGLLEDAAAAAKSQVRAMRRELDDIKHLNAELTQQLSEIVSDTKAVFERDALVKFREQPQQDGDAAADDWMQVAKGLVDVWRRRALDSMDKVDKLTKRLKIMNEKYERCSEERLRLSGGLLEDDSDDV